MHRPCIHRGSIDAERIDTDQQGSLIAQIECRPFGEEGMALAIAVTAPIAIPTSMDEHGVASTCHWNEMVPIDGAPCSAAEPDQDSRNIDEPREGQVRQILPLGMALERRVDRGAAITAPVDPALLGRMA